MLLGAVLGTPLAFAAFGGLVWLTRKIPVGTDGPPWIAIGVLAATVAALLAMPMIDSIRDMRGPKEHTRLDTSRWIATAIVIAIAVLALPALGALHGNELGEAGVFMGPFSLAGALAVLGADHYCRRRDRHRLADLPDDTAA